MTPVLRKVIEEDAQIFVGRGVFYGVKSPLSASGVISLYDYVYVEDGPPPDEEDLIELPFSTNAADVDYDRVHGVWVKKGLYVVVADITYAIIYFEGR
jgi:hypothetical protein